MNKKSAFTVLAQLPRKMGSLKESNATNAIFVVSNL
jgi:hypothetical protein